MTTASCPKCRDKVALPAGASPKATVRCPLCQDEFLLSEILDAMPPVLIVVDDPEAAVSPTAETPAVRPLLQGVEGKESPVGGAELVSPAPSFGIATSVAPSTTARAGRKRRAAARPKKKKNPAMEVVKIALGGIAGLAIAQLILWWNPWRKVDPFDLAPKLGGIAPWIVPQKFAAGDRQKSNRSGTSGKEAIAKPDAAVGKQGELPVLEGFIDPNKGGPVGRSKQAKKPGSKPKTRPSADRGAAAADASVGLSKSPLATLPDEAFELPNAKAKTTDLGSDLVGDLSIDLDPRKMLEPVNSPKPKDASAGLPEPAVAAESSSGRFANAPVVTADESKEAFEDAHTISRAWNLAEDADSLELLRQTYRTLARLGEVMTFAAPDVQPDETDVADLLKSLTEDAAKLTKLGQAGEVWTRSKRDSTGVVLRGVVKSIERKGDLYQTQLMLPSGGDPISLYSDKDPANTYRADSDILILGAIIQDPRANLSGYVGEAKTIVWSRLAVVVPK